VICWVSCDHITRREITLPGIAITTSTSPPLDATADFAARKDAGNPIGETPSISLASVPDVPGARPRIDAAIQGHGLDLYRTGPRGHAPLPRQTIDDRSRWHPRHAQAGGSAAFSAADFRPRWRRCV
jgi:hypothetical protein